MKRPTAWLMIAIAAMLGGCCSKQYPKTANRICVQGVDKQAVMDSSQKVLENMHFIIEKADADAGYISTRPLPAGQFFEIWRSDTVGCYNFFEDNIHSVTRMVEINIVPQKDDFCIECKVDTRRLSMPQRDIGSASELPGFFTRGSVSLQSLAFKKPQRQAAAWMDMGPDTELESKILQKIAKRLSDVGM